MSTITAILGEQWQATLGPAGYTYTFVGTPGTPCEIGQFNIGLDDPTYFLRGTPTLPGTYLAQVNKTPVGSSGTTLLSFTINVGLALTFDPIPNTTIDQPPFTVTATSYIGQSIAFSILFGPATVSGNTVTITGPGTITIRATASGNGHPDHTIDHTFIVSKRPQVITISPIANRLPTTPPFAVTATASSGLTPVSLSIVSGPATISGATITLTGDYGTVVLRAYQAGDDTYAPVTLDIAFAVVGLFSSSQWAYCPSGKSGRPSFGHAHSIVSQDDADSLALLVAQSKLVCSLEKPIDVANLTFLQARFLCKLGYSVFRPFWSGLLLSFDGHSWLLNTAYSSDRHVVVESDLSELDFRATDWACLGVYPPDYAEALKITFQF